MANVGLMITEVSDFVSVPSPSIFECAQKDAKQDFWMALFDKLNCLPDFSIVTSAHHFVYIAQIHVPHAHLTVSA